MNILLHFAYRKEAQFFIKEWGFELIPDANIELFQTKDASIFLLITGEGIDQTINIATRALSYLEYQKKKKIDLVLNLGIAGSLRDDLTLNEVVSAKLAIRTNINEEAYFQSFELAKIPLPETNGINKVFTAVSSDKRINQFSSRQKLQLLGDIVDRELWAMALVGHEQRIPCGSWKLISDFAIDDSCQTVSTNLEELSAMLFKKCSPLVNEILKLNGQMELHYTKNQSLFSPEILKLPDFYFTQTQKHQLKKLYLGLKITNNEEENVLLRSDFFISLKHKETTPKKRASELLLSLYSKLNPFLIKHQSQINEVLSPLQHPSITFDLDKKLEDETLHIHLEIKNNNDFQAVKKQLNNFDYPKFKELIFGKNV